jgi:hypothetical protein
VSIEVVAIAVTGLIGMIGYLVQARSAQKASNAQASLVLEAAEREKVEVKAGKQLEHVQLQTSEFVRPLVMDITLVYYGWAAMAKVRRPRDVTGFVFTRTPPRRSTRSFLSAATWSFILLSISRSRPHRTLTSTAASPVPLFTYAQLGRLS